VTIDLQVLGIGGNGHIGFNEPGTPFDQETFVVKLTDKTREDNKRFFNSLEEVPTHAMTMGIKNIMKSKKILMLISGKSKVDAAYNLLKGPVTEQFPASILQKHPDATVIIDEEAYAKLK
jgi:glucosamine-6-phosphate deaminase